MSLLGSLSSTPSSLFFYSNVLLFAQLFQSDDELSLSRLLWSRLSLLSTTDPIAAEDDESWSPIELMFRCKELLELWLQIAQYVRVRAVYTCTCQARGEYCNVCSKLEHTVSDGRTTHRYIYTYISCTFVPFMWGSLRLAPIIITSDMQGLVWGEPELRL